MNDIKELAGELSTFFLVNDYKWKFDYGMANPDADDIERTLNKAKEYLEEKEEATLQMEVGRLILKKRDGYIDVFVMVGTIGEKNERAV